jgi:YVTN family beta-propeller protein
MLLGRIAWRAVAAGAAVTSLALASAAGPATAAVGAGTRLGKHDPVIPVSAAGWGRERLPVTAYVVNYLSSTVTPIRTTTNTAGTAIPVGDNPVAIAITPNGKTAYVANFDFYAGTVTPIRTAVNRAGAAIPVENGPQAIAITP